MRIKEVPVRMYQVEMVKRTKNADVVISKKRNCYDFMAIGITCMEKTINGEEPIIKVAYKPKFSNKRKNEVKAYSLKCVKVVLKSNAFLEQSNKDSVFEYVTSNFHESCRKGIKMVLPLASSYFTMKVEGLEEDLPITIPEFSDCFDTVEAQKAVQKLLQENIDM